MDGTWSDAGRVFDSAVRAKGAKYFWTYLGFWSTTPRNSDLRSPMPNPLVPPPGRHAPGLCLI